MSEALEDDADEGTANYWTSVADLMSGLMIVFLFIAVTFMAFVSRQQQQVRRVAVAWEEGRGDLYRALEAEFRSDLLAWNAELDSLTLSVRFKEPDVLFEAGRSVVRPRFQEILRDFFPRYARIVRAHGTSIEEVRIEGHTSSEGPGSNPYFYNMALSQDRTRAVLEFCLERSGVEPDDREWLRGLLTANGLSSSKVILATDSTEDRERSRRVEFRVRTNAEIRIAQILEMAR
ncbi:MAG: OmpA family protein [Gemmatimonadales bacterium]|nr:OmpA family protein [Gemmatimonadales bacterium]MDZ4388670.1 OmpA family protein [Gemmatimonadales bacterium]